MACGMVANWDGPLPLLIWFAITKGRQGGGGRGGADRL
jgi:hypothetical protein